MHTNEIKNIGKVNFHDYFDDKAFTFRHEKFSELIPENSIVLDIGAHSGYFSIVFGSCVGATGKVLAFEPNPKVYEVLKENSKNNPKFNIIPYNLACTPENKNYIFNYSDPNIYNTGMNGGLFDNLEHGDQIKSFHAYKVDVVGVNVVDFLNKNHADLVDNIKFIKTDTEGLDKEVLKTLRPIIEKNKPVLMVEAFTNLSNEEMEDYYNVLKSFDYEIYDVSPLDNKTDCVGPLTKEEFKYYIKRIVDNGNFFCFHKDEIHKYNLPKIISNKTAAIVSNRNDGYKEKERFIIHLTTLLETFDEVIYVDWNSPTQSLLYEIIDELPKTNKLKHIVISKEIHNIFKENIPNLPNCYDSLALNIALRRTDAEWIVITTSDIIAPFKKDFLEFLQICNKTTFYTLSRRETEYEKVIENKDHLDEYRIYLNNTSQPRFFSAKVTPNDNYSIINCCGDFQLAHRNVFLKIRGFEENMCYKCFIDTNIQKKAVLYGFDLKAHYDLPLYHMSHKNMIPQDGDNKNTHEIAKNNTSPIYNDVWHWVEEFNKYYIYDHIMISRNTDNWGLADTEIEFEVF